MELLLLALLALGAFTAICLASFAIAVVVTAIVESLRKSGNTKEVLIPKFEANELISTVKQRNPALGTKIAKAFDDDDDYEEKKMGFIFDANKEIVGIEKIKARNTSEDDIQDVTTVFSSGRYKTYA